jgi:membrane peptidoglycan carboxypeptidase
MKPETAAAVRDAFEGVVMRGTGKKAALEGYRAAGKTGTAQKIVDGRYSSSKYVASFIGFAPLPKARITVLVQINEPKNAIYGGDVSAPIFRAISQGALLALGVPPDQPMPMATPKIDRAIPVDTRDYRPDATPLATVAGTQDTTETSELDVIRVRVASASVSVPDFTGMSKRTVVERGHEIGLRIQTSGTGNAVSQIPPAGTLLAGGETCIVTFSVNKPAQGPKHAVPVPGNVIAAGRQEVIRR